MLEQSCLRSSTATCKSYGRTASWTSKPESSHHSLRLHFHSAAHHCCGHRDYVSLPGFHQAATELATHDVAMERYIDHASCQHSITQTLRLNNGTLTQQATVSRAHNIAIASFSELHRMCSANLQHLALRSGPLKPQELGVLKQQGSVCNGDVPLACHHNLIGDSRIMHGKTSNAYMPCSVSQHERILGLYTGKASKCVQCVHNACECEQCQFAFACSGCQAHIVNA